jgi:hypothetical protein
MHVAMVHHGSPGPSRRAIGPFWTDLVTLTPECPDESGLPRDAFSIVWDDMASGCTKVTLVEQREAWEELKRLLDEDRLSERPLYDEYGTPEEGRR